MGIILKYKQDELFVTVVTHSSMMVHLLLFICWDTCNHCLYHEFRHEF
jgi:hypothetical protein